MAGVALDPTGERTPAPHDRVGHRDHGAFKASCSFDTSWGLIDWSHVELLNSEGTLPALE
jgi:hypothetical protein